ncbi:MAG: TonB-dependent receptor plug domain-containing protein, partial [Myxococcota bacterium]|nr:TonB-dependent receptor plug domain-containing protein [Myxococcota bacterium]
MPKQYRQNCNLWLSVLIALTPTSIFASDNLGLNLKQWESLVLDEGLSIKISTASVATETLLDAPAPMYVLTRKEIRRRGYVDITDIMKDLPGFDNAHVGGSGELYTYQRGFRSAFNSRTLVLLNGQNFTPLWYQSVPLGPMIPIEAIEKIEILYGPAGAIYGPNAFLGVINIITTDASSLETGTHQVRASLSAGSYDTKRVDIHAMAKLTDSISMTLTARFGRTDGADVSERDNKWLHNDYASSKTIWGPMLDRASNGHDYGSFGNPDDDHMFMASLTLGDFKLNAYNYLRSASNGPEYAGDRLQSKNFWPAGGNGVYIEHNKQWNDNIQLKSRVSFRTSGTTGLWADAAPSWDEGQSQYSYLSYTEFHTANNALSFEQNVTWDVTDDLRLSAGYRFLRKQLTKAFDIGDGYWGAYNSNGADDNSAIYNTVPCDIDPDDDVTDDGYTNYETDDCEPWDNGAIPAYRMPFDNLVLTEDI